LQTRTSE